MVKDTSIIVDEIYPMVEKSLVKNTNNLKKCIGKFITNRYDELYDTGPNQRIYFGVQELNDFYKAIQIQEYEVMPHLQKAFFWNLAYNPPQIKEPFVCLVLMCIRYYLKKNDMKNAELCSIYLAFSGKFYASNHAHLFPYLPQKPIMDYVINNKLTGKFDLRKEGNIFGAVRSLCITWLDTYKNIIKGHIDDENCGMVIQQLRDRERSWLYNIMNLYREAHENQEYLNYESDNYEDGENFRIVDNDSQISDKFTNATVHYLTTNNVDYAICKNMCADQNVKALEIKDIMESILSNKDYQDDIYKVVNILITDFMKNNKGKQINSLEFISYSIKTKPNTKDKNIIEMKTIILSWLDENSEQYRKRKSRTATAISYYKAILKYFIIAINKVSK